ncbi:Phosphoribosylaminoimidazole carboxylase, ATPase subunit [Beggiatoa sp. PS]|nr:Phosphoribosylaminoimidazole carboxylase, ATPase subunit [Beggiatoa sp. PS]
MNQTIFSYPIKRIGIIGGGQLGKMTAQAAKQMGFYVTVLDATPRCPAAHIADAQIIGHLHDADKLRELAKVSDILTYEIEHIDTQTLTLLHDEGYTICPSPKVLVIIQDKYLQKQILAKNHVPVPDFKAIEELTPDMLAEAKFPIVQKARKGGYDGRGVVVLKSPEDIKNALQTPSMLEEFIDFTKELAVIIARTPTGETMCYPVVEMVFDEQANICDIVVAPARINKATALKAREVALHAVEAVEGVGIFGVEMFLTHDGQILVNEIAPRPHNSGHYTIEACVTSQFEQLVRILTGLPLGNCDLLRPAVMLNLLGEPGYTGIPVIEGLQEALSIPGLSFHFYDKATTYPLRKMGHVTILDENLDNAIANRQYIKNILKIKGQEKINPNNQS